MNASTGDLTGRGRDGAGRTADRASRWHGIPPAGLWAVWLVSRTALYLLALDPRMTGDVGIYQHWYACCLSHSAFPAADPMWQYPPGAALVFWLPGSVAGGYVSNFVLLAIGCDLAVTLLLLGRARRGGSAAGAWFWVCGVPLLGGVSVTRFDVAAVALAVAALCLAGRDGARGALIGAAAAIKIWPVLLLAGAPASRWRRDLAGAAVALGAVCAIFAGATAAFAAHQAHRGVEIESVLATPLMIWRQAGWAGPVAYRFGAMQFGGWPAALTRDACLLGLVLAAAAVLGWRRRIAAGRARWRPEFATDAPLAVTLLFLVVSPVLSPQYLLWVIGLAAVCLATGRTTQRPAALAVLAAAGLTQLIFPAQWPSLVSGSVLATGVLTARNLLLVVAAVLSGRRILRASSTGPRGSAQEDEQLTAAA